MGLHLGMDLGKSFVVSVLNVLAFEKDSVKIVRLALYYNI